MGNRVEELKQMVSAGSLAADYTSAELDVSDYDQFAVEFSWTGTPTGVLYIEASATGVVWEALALSEDPAPAGADGTKIVEVVETAMPKIRIFYDRTSGDGSLSVSVYGRGR